MSPSSLFVDTSCETQFDCRPPDANTPKYVTAPVSPLADVFSHSSFINALSRASSCAFFNVTISLPGVNDTATGGSGGHSFERVLFNASISRLSSSISLQKLRSMFIPPFHTIVFS
jgi:hypothetical protein